MLAGSTEAQATDPRPCSSNETRSEDDGSGRGRREDEAEEQREQRSCASGFRPLKQLFYLMLLVIQYNFLVICVFLNLYVDN